MITNALLCAQADLIGAEFKDPQAAQGQPLHEQLYTKLVAAGIYSSHGRDHMITTVHSSCTRLRLI